MKGELDSNERLIFVSHSSQDTWVAKQIAREIKDRGGTPFLDEAEVNSRTSGLKSAPPGNGVSRLWLYYLGSRPANCRLGTAYRYFSRGETSYN
jgi:hypothetical protein